MKNCLNCKNIPSTLLKTNIQLSDKYDGYCNTGIYMRYKRPKNVNDTVFGFVQKSCSGYCANGQ